MPSSCTASTQRCSRDEACSSTSEIEAACSSTSASSSGDFHVSTHVLPHAQLRCAGSLGKDICRLRCELSLPSAVGGGARTPPSLKEGAEAELAKCEAIVPHRDCSSMSVATWREAE